MGSDVDGIMVQEWVGQPVGCKVGSTDKRGFLYLLAPTPELWTQVTPLFGGREDQLHWQNLSGNGCTAALAKSEWKRWHM